MNKEKSLPNTEFSVRKMLDDIREYAGREPAKTIAAAFGVGLLINLLPSRVVMGTLTVVGAAILRPALFSLGVAKAAELCCQKNLTLSNP